MKTVSASAFFSLVLLSASPVDADTFGSGLNMFGIEFVTIGNAGNADDTAGNPNPAGKVDYTYRMGKYEISEDMIDKANALGSLGITKDTRGLNKPATGVSWLEAAQFVNWLNTNTNNTPAYKFDTGGNFQLWQSGDAGYNANNLFRNSLAKYFLPSTDEWFKTAYFDPGTNLYYDYPTGSNNVPDGVDFAGDSSFDAVFFDGHSNSEPNDITDAGLLSPYGTAGQGGNVFEWQETEFDSINDSTTSARSTRGGSWSIIPSSMQSSSRISNLPTYENGRFGFRVASIPEPSSLIIAAIAVIVLLERVRLVSQPHGFTH